ncbi:MAG: MBL fold metallo-hydrolase [Acidobacteria bacterium]|nr:MBL fold metallo-hydrolase [Acidobacteriota bacterium]
MSFRRLLATAALVAAVPVFAASAAAQQAAQDVQVTTTRLGGNVYAVDGQGGRITALVGTEGIFLVDAQFPQVTEKIVAALRALSPAPIRLVVNTHVHGDHTGGNANFGALGATIMAQPNLRARLLKPSPGANGQVPPPAPAAALPTITYTEPLTIQMNGEEVRIVPLPPSHTDGDTVVKFVTADVLSTGDVFRSVGFPNIDRTNGGTLAGLLQSLDTFITLAGPNTKVAPGHGAVTNREALVFHRQVVVTVRDRVAAAIAQGRSVEEVVASKPTADFDERVGNAMASADRFVQQVYAELRGAR